jgi:hypothetical protein
MMRCPETPFQFGCTCVNPHSISELDVLKVFDTHLGVQGMEGIFELWHYLVLLLMHLGPSHVLVIIISHKVILFLDHIHKKIPSGIDPKHSRILCGHFLPIIFPPMFDMRESLKEHKGDLFSIRKIVNREITF